MKRKKERFLSHAKLAAVGLGLIRNRKKTGRTDKPSTFTVSKAKEGRNFKGADFETNCARPEMLFLQKENRAKGGDFLRPASNEKTGKGVESPFFWEGGTSNSQKRRKSLGLSRSGTRAELPSPATYKRLKG